MKTVILIYRFRYLEKKKTSNVLKQYVIITLRCWKKNHKISKIEKHRKNVELLSITVVGDYSLTLIDQRTSRCQELRTGALCIHNDVLIVKMSTQEARESHTGPPPSAHEDCKRQGGQIQRTTASWEGAVVQAGERSQWREAEKAGENEREEANNKVSPQSPNMRCDKVDHITARKSDLRVCDWAWNSRSLWQLLSNREKNHILPKAWHQPHHSIKTTGV